VNSKPRDTPDPQVLTIPQLSDEMRTLGKKCFKLTVWPHLNDGTLTSMVVLFNPSYRI
jgi:hypothetical protein